MADIPQIPAMNLSNRALVEMGRSSAAMENFTKAIDSKAGKELIKVIDQYNEVLKIAGTIEAADTYAASTRARADDDAAKALAETQRQAGILNDGITKQNTLLDTRSAQLTTDIAANDARKTALDMREGIVMDSETQNELDAAENKTVTARLVKADADLDKRVADINQAEADLKARADRIAAAVA